MKQQTHSNLWCVTALLTAVLSALANPIQAGSKDDPLLTKVLVDRLEVRDADGDNPWLLDGQVWMGKDLQKLWFKTDVERIDGKTKGAELQALFSRAVTPFWDFQVGLRKDFQPAPGRNWAVIGVQGLAPYFFDVEAALFMGESGRTALRAEAEYELLITQRLILQPRLALNAYGKNDLAVGIGAGLSDVAAGLRLRYEFSRQFAPYIGVEWTGKFGNTADYARAASEHTRETQWLLGLRVWF